MTPAAHDGGPGGDAAPAGPPSPRVVSLPGGMLLNPAAVRAVTRLDANSTRVHLRHGRRSHVTVAEPMTAVLARLEAAS